MPLTAPKCPQMPRLSPSAPPPQPQDPCNLRNRNLPSILGASKCSFHIYAVNKSSKIVRLRNNDVLRRKHQPVVYGVVNFASSDAPASGTGQTFLEQDVSKLPLSESNEQPVPHLSEALDTVSTTDIGSVIPDSASDATATIIENLGAPFFISMFMGIRGMAGAPVQSFHEGGLFWFVDLTLPDQFYLLPLITSATLSLTVEVRIYFYIYISIRKRISRVSSSSKRIFLK
ncbi:unnamed protein product [Nesidiocoris tenuis]|uniref:Uncharacterized protein n=1 Tax=Nesidiocoris tenuis TaxID=355587 RepID=A0A6H5H601_9HEMI|nr:unnamed protein product [Nesidiocoris tenuis]